MFAAKIAHRCNEEALFKSKQLCGFQIIKNATEEEEKCLSQSKSLCEEAISVLTVPSAGHRISLRKSSKPLGWFITQLGLSASRFPCLFQPPAAPEGDACHNLSPI